MKDYILNNGFWFYKDCGCRIPGTLYRNNTGLEIKITMRTGEWTISRDGTILERGILAHYIEKLKKYL